MRKFKVIVPFVDDMGSIDSFIATSSPMETARENALWTINSMRRHDGLRELNRLPRGTKLELIEE
jgi:hypothetical protein